jgi:hypothetical protein
MTRLYTGHPAESRIGIAAHNSDDRGNKKATMDRRRRKTG